MPQPAVTIRNLLADLPPSDTAEVFESLFQKNGVTIERIVSSGQASPPEFWYDQPQDEWVLILQGNATLEIDGDPDHLQLSAGDSCLLPAHCRHRVAATSAEPQTIWLAVHVLPT